MGFDLVTWNPAVGGGGADQWDAPATSRWMYGATGGYGATPSIAQINAGTGINQIIALLRRRVNLWNALAGTALTCPDYWGGERLNKASLTAIRDAIDALRTAEGFTAAFSWQSLSGTPKGWTRYIGELRRALRIAGAWGRPRDATTGMYRRRDVPYGTREEADDWGGGDYVGKLSEHIGGGDYRMTRTRQVGPHYMLPDWIGTADASLLSVSYASPVQTTLDASYAANLYASTADIHLSSDPAIADAMDVLIGSTAVTLGATITETVPAAVLSARAGGWLCTILAQSLEAVEGGNSGSSGASRWDDTGIPLGNWLTIDYGA